ncbi:hypothetical protein HanIR_Chr16g0794431 [Helianthus annuus]|nr:hypothetical protein HanIR_Chr16g0794431 [Helianthus annuus]
MTRPDPIRTGFFTYIPRGLKFLKIFRTPMKKFLGPPLVVTGSQTSNRVGPNRFFSRLDWVENQFIKPVLPEFHAPSRATLKNQAKICYGVIRSSRTVAFRLSFYDDYLKIY